MQITVHHNQTFLDLSIQYTGTPNNAFEISKANDLQIFDDLKAGTTLIIPDKLEKDNQVYKYYVSRNISPATGVIGDNIEISPLSGIGYWEIEKTFEIQ